MIGEVIAKKDKRGTDAMTWIFPICLRSETMLRITGGDDIRLLNR